MSGPFCRQFFLSAPPRQGNREKTTRAIQTLPHAPYAGMIYCFGPKFF
jgi:hypothetical protein